MLYISSSKADFHNQDNILELVECVDNTNPLNPGLFGAYCVYSPLVMANLADTIKSYTLNTVAKAILCRDYLAGLLFLHEKGIMHRDIKPANLGVSSMRSPKGVILDLDSATTEVTSDNHMKGTTTFLAPEIVALKLWQERGSRGTKPLRYSKQIDLWALGLSVYGLWRGFHFTWSRIARTSEEAPERGLVTEDLHDMLRQDLMHRLNLLDEGDQLAIGFLATTKSLTEYGAAGRSDAATLIHQLSTVIPNDRVGVIAAKTVISSKRSLPALGMEPEHVKRARKE